MIVGLVGCGAWGRHVLRDLVSLGCEVRVVARSPESIARARAGGAAGIVDAVEALPAMDGVVVAASTSAHAAILEEVLERGVPVYCEKPLTNDSAAAARLAALAPERLFVMDKWRYHPGVLELATIARDGRLGAVLGLRTVRVGWGNPHDDVDAVWVLMPHDLSIAIEIMGEVARPHAAVVSRLGDSAVGLTGLLRGDSWWHAVEVSSVSPERRRRVELVAEDGIAVLAGGWDDYVSIFRHGGAPPVEERVETLGELPLLAELRAFVGHLQGGLAPRSSASEGAAVVAAIAELRALAEVA